MSLVLPIWVSGWEIDCCVAEAVVGQAWSGPSVWLGQETPWWAEYPGPEPSDVVTVGMADFEADVITAGHSNGQPGIVRVGGLDIVVPAQTGTGRQRFRGHLSCQGHLGPKEVGFGMRCGGTVRRIRGIAFGGEKGEIMRVPGEQPGPTELTATGACRSPDYVGNGFSQFLLDLEIDS